MVNLIALSAANAQRWQQATLTRKTEAVSVAKSLISASARQRYQTVEQYTGVPWPVVAVIHERESSQDWGASLAQGDPWDKVSVHVPAGRGPFKSWTEAAIDALIKCPPYLARHKDWSIAGTLTALETYNGIGYASRGVPSPYLWAGTDQYRSGKYIRDGVYDPNKIDPQLGCAALLKAMMELDHTITFAGVNIIPPEPKPPPPQPKPAPVPSPAPAPSFWSVLLSAILSLFKGK